MKYTVKVNQKLINDGFQHHAFKCPIALGINEATGGNKKFSVCNGRAVDMINGLYAVLPGVAEKWYKEFDAYGRSFVKPFEFVLHVEQLAA